MFAKAEAERSTLPEADDKHTMYEANRARRSYNVMLFPQRYRKRIWERKKAQNAPELPLSNLPKVEQALFDALANAFLHGREVISS